jgi:hypothetical protein
MPKGLARNVIDTLVLVLCLVFASIGLLAGWSMTGRPLLRWWTAQTWPAMQCEVISSQVATHADIEGGDTGETYSIDIEYRYHIGGRPFTSRRYDFMQRSDTARADQDALVETYPPGRVFECFVDPDDPAEALISRRFRKGYLFGLLFVGAFTVIPMAVAVGTVPAWLKRRVGMALAASDTISTNPCYLDRYARH